MQTDNEGNGIIKLNELPAGAFSAQLRDPLTNIFATLPLIAKHSDEVGKKYCAKLLHSAYRMLYVTGEIEMAGMLAQIDIEAKPANLTSAVDAIRSATAECVREIPIGGVSKDGPLVVRANLNVLLVAILGVLRNALQYTRDGNRIEIDLSRNEGQAILRISDRGLGIKPMHKPYIFDPYYSVDPYDDTLAAPGLGLGLAILRRATQHLAGSVASESEFGQGTTIVMSLPLAGVGGEVDTCSAADLLLNRFSPLYVQLCGYCRLPCHHRAL